MHELAIAGSVVEIASRHASGRRVERVELKVGSLRDVAPSALEFAFELLALGTCLEGAELAIEDVPASTRCGACGAASAQSNAQSSAAADKPGGLPLRCSRCGSSDVQLVSGEELVVDGLALVEEPTPGNGLAACG